MGATWSLILTGNFRSTSPTSCSVSAFSFRSGFNLVSDGLVVSILSISDVLFSSFTLKKGGGGGGGGWLGTSGIVESFPLVK